MHRLEQEVTVSWHVPPEFKLWRAGGCGGRAWSIGPCCRVPGMPVTAWRDPFQKKGAVASRESPESMRGSQVLGGLARDAVARPERERPREGARGPDAADESEVGAHSGPADYVFDDEH